MRQLGWIHAWRATLSDAAVEEAFAYLASVGYNPLAFRKIIQTPDQIGLPGFWNDGVRRNGGAPDPPDTGASHDPR